MKKAWLWIGCIAATPIVLFALLTVLLYLPPVQQYVVQKAADAATEALGMKAKVGRVRITPFFDFSLQDFLATQGSDTVLQVKELVADVPFRPLLDGRVDINGLELKGAKMNTLQLIESVKISGALDYLALDSRSIFLKEQQVKVQKVDLKKADLQILLRDSVPEDTTSEPTNWKVDLEKVNLDDTRLQLLMDSMDIRVGVGQGKVRDLHMDLAEGLYQVDKAQLSRSSLGLDLVPGTPAEGFDYQHIVLDSLELDAQSILSHGSILSAKINKGSMTERSGLKLTSLSGLLNMDASSMHAKELQLTTPYSSALLNADVDMSALDEKRNDGQMNVALDAVLGKPDVLLAVGPGMAGELNGMYPDRNLTARLNMQGNMQRLDLTDTYMELQNAVRANLSGTIFAPTSDENRKGEIKLDAQTQNLDFLLTMLKVKDFAIPHGMIARGKATFQGSRYSYDGIIRQGKGLLTMNGVYDTKSESYNADLKVDSLNLHDFMPKDSLYYFAGNVTAKGKGTDIFSARTEADIQAQIRQFQYGPNHFEGIGADLQLQNHLLTGNVSSDNRYLDLLGSIDGYLAKDTARAKLDVEVTKLDLKELNVARDSMVWSFRLGAEAQTNVKDSLQASASLTGVTVATRKRTFTPKDMHTQLLVHPDSVFAHVDAGDFYLDIQTEEGVDTLMARVDSLQRIFTRQFAEKQFHLDEVQNAWPRACIKLHSGVDNPFSNYFGYLGYSFKRMNLHFDVSPEEGLDGDLDIYSLRVDSILLDTVRFVAEQQDSVLRFNGQVRNNRRNPQFVFNALYAGRLMTDGAMARLNLYDAKNVQAIDLAARARFVENGVRFTFHPDRPVLAYQPYNLTPGGFIQWHDDGRLEGDMSILNDDGMGLVFKGAPQEGEKQHLQLQFRKIDLDQFTSVLPYVPRISGIMDGELTATQPLEGRLRADGILKFQDLAYENSPMGETVEVALTMEPEEEDIYNLVGTLRRNGQFVTTMGGDYNTATGEMDLETILYRFPADMVNGFIPDHVVGMRGIMEGRFHLEGNTASPLINGTLKTDSVFLYSDMYAVNLRLEDKEMNINNSRLSMRNLNLLAENNDKMTLNGTVDFSDLENILLNLSMRATNFNIIDKPKNSQSLVYGKAYVDANATVTGPLDELKLKGSVSLLGSTDVAYVLKDSPLTVEDRLSELVTFVDFNDTILVDQEIVRKQLSGVDARLEINIDEGAKVSCDLSSNRESYVDLIGGGTLILRFTPEGKLLMNGRYTINEGEMKYALPVIPLKTFKIATGSYVEFTGDVMNPKLNITATERMRSSVSNGEGGASRTVDFNVGVLITKTLSDMGLEFTIEAPEDITVQNDLASMSKETQGRLAVTMLATGIYNIENSAGKGGGLNMNSALSSFLQSEISSIAGSALKTIDVQFGIEDGTSREGKSTTDYSFRFAKRLWGNRVSIIIGGKVSSSGSQVENDSFIDDISLEYRLDNSGTRYVRLFHESNFDALLDGQIKETGGGIVLRKKMTRLGELFIFRNSAQRDRINMERQLRREQAEEEDRHRQEGEEDQHQHGEGHHHHDENDLLEKAERQRQYLDQKMKEKQE